MTKKDASATRQKAAQQSEARMKSYPEGSAFAGRIGRTWQDSEPAFPMPPTAPRGAPNITRDIGCDKGGPATDDYPPLASFSGRIERIEFDLKPDFHRDPKAHTEDSVRSAMIRQ